MTRKILIVALVSMLLLTGVVPAAAAPEVAGEQGQDVSRAAASKGGAAHGLCSLMEPDLILRSERA